MSPLSQCRDWIDTSVDAVADEEPTHQPVPALLCASCGALPRSANQELRASGG